jgi:hypothetical protein
MQASLQRSQAAVRHVVLIGLATVPIKLVM